MTAPLRYDWDAACDHLARVDPHLRPLIERFGEERLQPRRDLLYTLARSIVGQQISVRAAQTIWDRFIGVVGEMTPEAVLEADPDALRRAGLSRRKVDYLLGIARGADGLLATDWDALDDESAVERFSALRGVGRWTAEMLLIFHLERPDVLPLGDIGLLRAVGRLHGEGVRLDPDVVEALAEPWRPWRSVATWLLWRSLDPIPVEY